ncbi:CCR4-Not complex component, Not1-domain-containing protein [Dimargaris cristalligena]|uniref:General negative regulator of transcription subunit 1 n=1 Tax=Dimargaris cristalligena TaxID=215637 RepID=A0A4P9ZP76_9FUNG|nr:CCR4-Not complex component, Not1-domain-containing protein [Dimargaris cristalligena]|eukprot:RKP34362.1 CCR4-Not complex component, Not1-domain-containing protein [Dimargaris cristalligena]
MPPEAEKTAESYYLRLYKGDVTISQLLDHLNQLRDSVEMREQKIYSCVVLCLLDEFKFLQNYPEKELNIYSVFFGAMVAHKLFPRSELGQAMKLLFEALQADPQGPLMAFGLTALAHMKERLAKWPQACRALINLPNLRQSNADVAEFLRQTVEALPNDPAAIPSDPYFNVNLPGIATESDTPSPGVDKSLVTFVAISVDPLPHDLSQDEPTEEVQDKILFIMNNVAQNNLDTKVDSMKQVLTPDTFYWFSQNILVKRASNQPNYHQLYSDLLDRVNDTLLVRCVLHETLLNIRVLLNSDKTVNDSTERSHLKNLGSWLGGLTLAHNKPIKYKNIAFKELLIEGYDGGRLIVAIPFVCKVLEQAGRSTVFKPPNPWLMAVVRVLVELYKFAELKLNLKFEIEVLCKSLNLDLNDIEPSSYLKERPIKGPATETTPRPSADVATPVGRDAVAVAKQTPPASHQFAYVPPTLHTPNEISTNIALLLTSHVKLTSVSALTSVHPHLKRLVLLTLERLLRDVMPVQVARAVLIASTSTQDLITKDFCMEPSEEKMRWAAHKMVRSLAGTLAIAQCRKPLQDGLYGQIREYLVQQALADPLSEQAALAIMNENIDLACAIVEAEATNRATREIDECLAPAFLARKQHRERTGQPFYDMGTFNSLSYPANIPAQLKVRSQGLQPQQLRLYDDFATIPHFASQTNAVPEHITPPDTAQLTTRQCLDKFSQYVLELDKLVLSTQINSFAELPQQHDIRLLMREILVLVIRSASRDETALDFAQMVVQLLYKNEGNLAREVFVILLDKLCGLSPKASREVTHWLTYADDERKYNVPVTVALIKASLISIPEQDRQLAKLMESGRTSVIDFTSRLVRKCVLDPQPCCAPNDFAASVEVLRKLAQRGRTPGTTIQLLEDLNRQTQPAAGPVSNVDTNAQLAYRSVLQEWVRLCDHSSTGETQLVNFVIQLQTQIPLMSTTSTGVETHAAFFRVAFDEAMEQYGRHRTAGAQTSNGGANPMYSTLDALARLVVLLVKYPAAKNGGEVTSTDEPQVAQFRTTLNYFALLLTVDHQQRRELLNQKPYFRFFVSLLNDLRAQIHKSEAVYTELLTQVATVFEVLQPANLPGFSFAWVSLVAHRFFLPRFLVAEARWPQAEKLLISALRFVAPALGEKHLTESVRLLYKGVVRIMLVILHDFPEFLCDYYTSFCDVIPSTCIQLRNLVVSAYARDMRLPEPLSQELKLDQFPEVQQDPRILSDFTAVLEANGLRVEIDQCLQSGQVDTLVTKFKSLLPVDEASAAMTVTSLDGSGNANGTSSYCRYNVPLINSTVLYVGIRAIEALRALSSPNSSAAFRFYDRLLTELEPDGRYLLLNAMANQLRHPSSHTYYFSRVLLHLFTENRLEPVKEQTTRVLIERAVVNRPLPWGLLVTLIDLMSNNDRYKFWDHKFTTIAPEISHILQAVSDSITSRA